MCFCIYFLKLGSQRMVFLLTRRKSSEGGKKREILKREGNKKVRKFSLHFWYYDLLKPFPNYVSLEAWSSTCKIYILFLNKIFFLHFFLDPFLTSSMPFPLILKYPESWCYIKSPTKASQRSISPKSDLSSNISKWSYPNKIPHPFKELVATRY